MRSYEGFRYVDSNGRELGDPGLSGDKSLTHLLTHYSCARGFSAHVVCFVNAHMDSTRQHFWNWCFADCFSSRFIFWWLAFFRMFLRKFGHEYPTQMGSMMSPSLFLQLLTELHFSPQLTTERVVPFKILIGNRSETSSLLYGPFRHKPITNSRKWAGHLLK